MGVATANGAVRCARRRRAARFRHALSTAICLLALVGCDGRQPGDDGGAAGDSSPPEPAPVTDTISPDSIVAPDDTAAWTTGIIEASPAGDGGTSLVTATRSARHPEYDRFTVELASDAALPGHHVEYVDRPLHECGSGRQIHPVGDAWLEIRLSPAAAHTEAGQPTLEDRGRDPASPGMLHIYRTCDFEGVVTFVLALPSPAPYRVFTLDGPPRLVVDVER